MTLTQEITLDIYDPPYFEYINAKQLDNVSRVLIITLTANGSVLKPDAETETAVFRALKPRSGASVLNPAAIGEDGRITVKLTDQTLAEDGKVEADVSIVRGDEVLSSATMYIQVTRAPVSDKQITSTDEFLVMTEATAKAKAAAKAADDAAGRADTAAQLLEGMTVTAEDVEPGGSPTAELTEKDGHYDLALGLPRGRDGQVQSVNGGTGDVIIGGRNLLQKSAVSAKFAIANVVSTDDIQISGVQDGMISGIDIDQEFPPGTYTLHYKYDAAPPSVICSTNILNGSFAQFYSDYYGKPYITPDPLSQGGKITFVSDVSFGIGLICGENGTITELKLERGNVATDWSPAPEDIPAMAPVQSVNGGTGNVVIGGRNLLLGSNKDLSANGFNVYYLSVPMDTLFGKMLVLSAPYVLRDAYGSGEDWRKRIFINLHVTKTDGSVDDYEKNVFFQEGPKTESGTFIVNIDMSQYTKDSGIDHIAVSTYMQGLTDGYAYIGYPKLEVGTVPTDWSLAPEDVVSSFNGQTGDIVSGAECNNLFLDTGYWEFGGLRGESAVGTSYKDTEFSNDEISSGAVFIRTKTPIKIPSSMKVSFNDEKYIVYILYYDREKKYLGRASGWLYESGYRFSASVENPAEYAGFILEGTKAAISPDDAADINLRIVNETIPDNIEARLAALEAAAGITYEPPVTDGPEIVGGEDMTR